MRLKIHRILEDPQFETLSRQQAAVVMANVAEDLKTNMGYAEVSSEIDMEKAKSVKPPFPPKSRPPKQMKLKKKGGKK